MPGLREGDCVSSDGCNCTQCNNSDDPYADEHDPECCCDDCHEYCHEVALDWEKLCDACRELVEEAKKETTDGNDK